MRWYSTRESVQAGEPSVLAIVETLLAMGASVWIGVHFRTWGHVWVGAALAPVVLLRGKRSEREAHRIAEFFISRTIHGTVISAVLIPALMLYFIYRASDITGILEIPSSFMFGGLPLWLVFAVTTCLNFALLLIVTLIIFGVGMSGVVEGVIARILGVVVVLIKYPVRTTLGIFGNWRSSVIVEDSAILPTMTPRSVGPSVNVNLEMSTRKANFVRDLQGLWTELQNAFSRLQQEERSPVLSRPITVLFLVANAVALLVSWVTLRLSIKSTAFVWLPVLWAIQPKKRADEPWKAHLRVLARDDMTKIVAGLSVVIILVIGGKFVLYVARFAIARNATVWESWVGKELAELVVPFFRPGEFPIWQVTAVLNAGLFLFAAHRIRKWHLRYESGLSNNEHRIHTTLEWLLGVRRILTIYAILCNFWAAWYLLKGLPMPPIGSKLFPWL